LEKLVTVLDHEVVLVAVSDSEEEAANIPSGGGI